MRTWLYKLKFRQKLKQFKRNRARPIKVEPLERFFDSCWSGKLPDGRYLYSRVRPAFFFAPCDRTRYTDELQRRFDQSCRGIIERADRALNHRFDLLGSKETYLGDTIDWHLDFKSGHRWPRDYYTRIPTVRYDDDSDIKVPWELSRLQHFTDLGRAWWLTRDDNYRKEFVDVVLDWEMENPVGYGVNWTCPMEAAFRTVNIIWGLYFFSDAFDDEFVRRVVRLLYYHGLFIERNLEDIGEGSNTNHLLSNYLGLFYLGTLFPEFDTSRKWQAAAVRGFEQEIRQQVFDDGADYECSTSYHRLVMEMLLSVFILGEKNGITFSQDYRQRVSRMIDFSLAVTAPSGRVPVVGDNDDGFVVKLSNDDPSVHTALIEIGLLALGRPIPFDLESTENRLWYLGPDAFDAATGTVRPSSTLFRQSGYAVVRNEDLHLLFSAGKVTGRHLAAHKHNDNLSFTLEIDSIPYLIDPGTSCYSADYKSRNLCRSTRVHNAVSVDNQEQSRYYEKRLFYMFNDARATIDLWMNTGTMVVVSGVHRGYQRLPGNINHRRTIWAFLEARSISVLDQFDGDSSIEHAFTTSFMTPIRDVGLIDNSTVRVRRCDSSALHIGFSGDVSGELAIQSACYYPRYGVKAPAQLITCVHRSTLPFQNVILISEGARTADWWRALLSRSEELTPEAWLPAKTV